jgi:hypothetical protein
LEGPVATGHDEARFPLMTHFCYNYKVVSEGTFSALLPRPQGVWHW